MLTLARAAVDPEQASASSGVALATEAFQALPR